MAKRFLRSPYVLRPEQADTLAFGLVQRCRATGKFRRVQTCPLKERMIISEARARARRSGEMAAKSKSFQDQLRTVWERAVEEVVGPVIRRLSRKVDTSGLIKLTIITAADCAGYPSAALHTPGAGQHCISGQPFATHPHHAIDLAV